MKRTMIGFIVLSMSFAFLVTACRSGPEPAAQPVQAAPTVTVWEAAMPPWVMDRQANPPENVFQGIGVATVELQSAANGLAESRARIALAQQMSTHVRNMVVEHTGASETSREMTQFYETVSRLLTEAHLRGTHPITRTYPAGVGFFQGWSVVSFARADANRAMADATSESLHVLSPERQAAVRALGNMDAAFNNTPQIPAPIVNE